MNQYIEGIGGDDRFKVGVGRVVYKDSGIKRGREEVLSIGRGFNKKSLGQYLWKLRVFFNIPRSYMLCNRFTKWSPHGFMFQSFVFRVASKNSALQSNFSHVRPKVFCKHFKTWFCMDVLSLSEGGSSQQFQTAFPC